MDKQFIETTEEPKVFPDRKGEVAELKGRVRP